MRNLSPWHFKWQRMRLVVVTISWPQSYVSSSIKRGPQRLLAHVHERFRLFSHVASWPSC